ncbi:MAG: glycosyltransferase family 4 protein [Thiohalobacteraceae bacterium]
MATRLTVVQILPAMESGGVERGTVEVGAELVRRGHRAIVISAGGRMVHELARHKVEHVDWTVGKKSLTTLRFIRRLRKFLRDERVDILHARSRLPAWIAYRAWRGMDPRTRPRFVTTVHGFYSVGRYSAVMTKGERVICVSSSVKDYVLANYAGVDPDKLRVIHRGVDPQLYPYGYMPGSYWVADWYRQYPALQEDYVVTLPARITRWKGQEDFVEIIEALVQRGLSVRGLLVGDTHPTKQAFAREIEALVRERGLEGRVIITGHRGDLREVMAMSDVVLSLSRDPEAFGRTTIEALSIGRPVCGYAHGGVKEQLEVVFPEGAVPVGDKQAVVDRIMQWYERPACVPDTKRFTLRRMLDATLAVYAELADAESSKGAHGSSGGA